MSQVHDLPAMSDFEVALELTTILEPYNDDVVNFIHEYKGQILGWTDSGERAAVGTISFYRANLLDAEGAGFSPVEVLDERTETSCYMHLFDWSRLDDFGHTLTNEARRALGRDLDIGNMLVVDRLEISSAYRGRDYGLQAVDLGMKHLAAGCSIAALKPYPLQLDPDGAEDNSPRSKSEIEEQVRQRLGATHKLVSYYRRVGFEFVPGTEVMIKAVGGH